MRKKYFTFGLLFSLLLILAACGGGAGSDNTVDNDSSGDNAILNQSYKFDRKYFPAS